MVTTATRPTTITAYCAPTITPMTSTAARIKSA